MNTTTKRSPKHTAQHPTTSAETLAQLPKEERDALRWLALVELPDDLDIEPCWTWAGAAHGQNRGYGKFWLNGKTISAHKAGYLLFRGAVTPGNVLGHKCDNERCCNPWHLEDQTQSANIQHCVEAGRHNSSKR